MRILILGGNGMLGYRLSMYLQKNHEMKVTLRWDLTASPRYGLFTPENLYPALAFEKATGYSAPGWNEMLEELGAEVRERQEKSLVEKVLESKRVLVTGGTGSYYAITSILPEISGGPIEEPAIGEGRWP